MLNKAESEFTKFRIFIIKRHLKSAAQQNLFSIIATRGPIYGLIARRQGWTWLRSACGTAREENSNNCSTN
jgi:hypothetical protein